MEGAGADGTDACGGGSHGADAGAVVGISGRVVDAAADADGAAVVDTSGCADAAADADGAAEVDAAADAEATADVGAHTGANASDNNGADADAVTDAAGSGGPDLSADADADADVNVNAGADADADAAADAKADAGADAHGGAAAVTITRSLTGGGTNADPPICAFCPSSEHGHITVDNRRSSGGARQACSPGPEAVSGGCTRESRCSTELMSPPSLRTIGTSGNGNDWPEAPPSAGEVRGSFRERTSRPSDWKGVPVSRAGDGVTAAVGAAPGIVPRRSESAAAGEGRLICPAHDSAAVCPAHDKRPISAVDDGPRMVATNEDSRPFSAGHGGRPNRSPHDKQSVSAADDGTRAAATADGHTTGGA